MVAHAILSPYGLFLYLYGCGSCMHILGDPQRVQMRNATTIAVLIFAWKRNFITMFFWYCNSNEL